VVPASELEHHRGEREYANEEFEQVLVHRVRRFGDEGGSS
jgi:hypothetical protein